MEQDMAEETIRVGVIGAGANTRTKHIPGLKAQEGVEIYGVVNRTRASSEKAAADFGIPNVYDDWQELLEDEEIDAVCIGTWPYMHHPCTLGALEVGKHVLVEARMAMNSDEAREMLAASRDNPHLTTQIVPAPHTLAVDQTMIDMISEGYIGDVVNVRAHLAMGSDFPDPDTPLHWRHDRDLSGNNIMGMGIFYEALMRWLGPASSVQALGQTVVKHRLNADGRRMAISIPDHLDVLCALHSGGTLNYTVTTTAGFSPSFDCWVYGTDGTIHLDSPDITNSLNAGIRVTAGKRGDSGLEEVEIPDEKRGGWRVEEEFINAVRGLEPVTHTNFVDGVKYMEFTDAVQQSMQTGEKVPLPF